MQGGQKTRKKKEVEEDKPKENVVEGTAWKKGRKKFTTGLKDCSTRKEREGEEGHLTRRK